MWSQKEQHGTCSTRTCVNTRSFLSFPNTPTISTCPSKHGKPESEYIPCARTHTHTHIPSQDPEEVSHGHRTELLWPLPVWHWGLLTRRFLSRMAARAGNLCPLTCQHVDTAPLYHHCCLIPIICGDTRLCQTMMSSGAGGGSPQL